MSEDLLKDKIKVILPFSEKTVEEYNDIICWKSVSIENFNDIDCKFLKDHMSSFDLGQKILTYIKIYEKEKRYFT